MEASNDIVFNITFDRINQNSQSIFFLILINLYLLAVIVEDKSNYTFQDLFKENNVKVTSLNNRITP